MPCATFNNEFNDIVFVEIICIEEMSILHVVDKPTQYQAARWLLKVTTSKIWRTMSLWWIGVYLGTSEIVKHDAGRQLIAKVF